MARPTKDRVRWTLERAAIEFGFNPRTIAARLKQAGLDPDPDGSWTTKQIVQAIYSSLEFERIRKTRAEADEVEKRNAAADRILVNMDELRLVLSTKFGEMAAVIKSSKMPDADKDALQDRLVDILKSETMAKKE